MKELRKKYSYQYKLKYNMSECPICFETMNDKNNNIKTECGHEFHSNCFLTNVVHNGFNCPCCRKELVKEQCSCKMYDYYDDNDSEISNDHDESSESEEEEEYEEDEEDENNELEPPFYYILHKLKDQINKHDLLTIIINSYRKKIIEKYLCINDRLIDNYVGVIGNFIELTDEEREIELMTMEDENCNKIRELKLVDDVDTIINMRVY